MTTRLFYPAGILVDATYVANVTDQEDRVNFDDLTEFAAGDYAPSFTGSSGYEPVFNVDTMDLKGVIGLCPVGGLYFFKSCLTGDVKLFFRQGTNAGVVYAENASQHTVMTMSSNSLLFWDQIKATQGRQATISMQVHGTDNGVNATLTRTPSQAITASPVVADLFTLGPLYLNGTLISSMTSMTWANNVQVDKIAANGEAAPSYVGIRRFRPTVTIETNDVHACAGYTVTGAALTDLKVFLRCRTRAGINYADASTEHIKLAATKGTYKVTRHQGQQTGATIEIHLERPSAGTAVFTTATGVAISAT